MRFWSGAIGAGAVLGILTAGCGEEAKPRRHARAAGDGKQVASAAAVETKAAGAEGKSAAGTGWGSIKGKIVWSGAELPPKQNLEVQKDTEWCLKSGPIPNEALVVDDASKGVQNVYVYLRKPSAIHPDFPQKTADVKAADAKRFEELNKIKPAELRSALSGKKIEAKNVKAPALLDQVHCKYVPHALALREGQTLYALNYEPISHNIMVAGTSGSNDSNINMPPGSVNEYAWKAEAQPLTLKCSIHGWMEGSAMVFDHPYYAVTGKDGSFEIKNAPAGEATVIIRVGSKYIDAKKGGAGSPKGAAVAVKANETVDLGEVKFAGQ